MSSGALNSNQSSSARAAPASESILTSPYQLAAKAALFRQSYSDSIGRTVQSAGFGSNRLGLNATDIRRAIDSLGFQSIRESAVEVDRPDDGKLTLAINIARNNPAFNGPSYLVMRPFVEPMHQLCSKWLLVRSMRLLEARMRQAGRGFVTGAGRAFTHEEFTAFTINLNDSNLEEILGQRPGMYLSKPTRGTMGQGQQLVHIRQNRVRQDLLQFLLTSQYLGMHRSRVILQRYIDRPLLIDKRKFDMRVYFLVVNAKRASRRAGGGPAQSGYFAFVHPGFVRLCTAPYDRAQTDLAVHLTNQSVQARHKETFAELKEVTTWYPDELNRYLNRRRRIGRRDWARDVLYPKVSAILGYISALYRRHLDDRDLPAGGFRILGVDMLVDAELRVHLLEFNEFPSWGRQTSVLADMKPNLWLEAASLVSEVAVRYGTGQPIGEQQLVTRQNFRLVYSSEDPGLARRNIARLYCD